MARVVLENVVKRYGEVLAVDHVSLECEDQEFLALLGPSGCGKTSTMRMIAGLEAITEGSLYLDGRRVNDLPPAERNVAMAFENYGLYPHMTVFGNIAYPLRIRRRPDDEIVREVLRIAKLLHIEPHLGRRPAELSGGVQQRISLARALMRKPSVFLMDEPISHLDAELRAQMRSELKRLHLTDGSTTIYVTHDQLEALSMADRVAVMHLGVLQQVATPIEIFERPANRFVATFIGEPPMNILAGTVSNEGRRTAVRVEGQPFAEPPSELAEPVLASAASVEGRVEVGVRPGDLEVGAPGGQGLPGTVRVREALGDTVLLTVDTPGHRLRVQVPGEAVAHEGDVVVLRPRPGQVHYFDIASGLALRSVEER